MKKKIKKKHFFPLPPPPSPGYPQDPDPEPDPDPHEDFCPDPDPQKKSGSETLLSSYVLFHVIGTASLKTRKPAPLLMQKGFLEPYDFFIS